MMATTLLGVVILGFLLTDCFANSQNAPQGITCGKHIIMKSTVDEFHKISYHGNKIAIPENINCTWTMVVEKEAFLQVKDFYLMDEDFFAVFESNDNKPLFGPLSGRQGSFVLALEAGNFSLVLRTSSQESPRGFSSDVQNSCSNGKGTLYKLNSVYFGSVRSPIYFTPGNGSFTCTITISGFGVDKKPDLLSVSINDYDISSGQLSIKDLKKQQELGGPYDFVGEKPPSMILTKNVLQFSLTINRNIPNQFLSLDYETASETCSKTIDLTSGGASETVTLSIQNEVIPMALTCHWLVTAPPNTHIHLSMGRINLVSPQDTLLVTGPLKSNFKPILLTSGSPQLSQLESVVVPSNELIFKFFSAFLKTGTFVQFTVSPNGHDKNLFQNRGALTLNHSSVNSLGFKMRVEEDQFIQLSWSTFLPPGAHLSLYSSSNLDSKPLMDLTSKFPLFSLTLASNQARLIVHKLDESWNLTFKGITEDESCDRVSMGSNTLFETRNFCEKKTCSWIVPPQDKEGVLEVSFPKLNLGSSGYISLYKLDTGMTPVVNFSETKSISTLHFPAMSGLHILVHRNCSQADTSVEALVLSKPDCFQKLNVSVGETIQVESPHFPWTYPLNLVCNWMISSSARFVLVMFNQFSISDTSHKVLITASDQTISISGSVVSSRLRLLPNDEFLVPPVNLQFRAPITTASLASGSGFLLTATAFECGEALSKANGTLSVPENVRFCIWSLSVPEKEGRQQAFLRLRMLSDSKHLVRVYDGSSIRNNLLLWDDNSTILSTGYHVMVVYHASRPTARNPLLEFATEFCKSANICGTGQCLQPWWRCNGINECGDYSDERFCPLAINASTTNSSTVSAVAHHSEPEPSKVFQTYNPKDGTRSTSSISGGASSGVVDIQADEQLSTESLSKTVNDHESFSAASSEISHSTLALSVLGALSVGLAIGAVVLFVYRKKFGTKDWSAINSSHHHLAADNESL